MATSRHGIEIHAPIGKIAEYSNARAPGSHTPVGTCWGRRKVHREPSWLGRGDYAKASSLGTHEEASKNHSVSCEMGYPKEVQLFGIGSIVGIFQSLQIVLRSCEAQLELQFTLKTLWVSNKENKIKIADRLSKGDDVLF